MIEDKEWDEDNFSVDEDEILDNVPEDLPEALQELAFAQKNNQTPAKPEIAITHRQIRPRPKLDTTDLLKSEDGLPMIRSLLQDRLPRRLSPREASGLDRALLMQDAGRVLCLFKDWAHTHMPAFNFETFCERAEKLGAKDHTLKAYLAALRAKIDNGSEGDFTEPLFLSDILMAEAAMEDLQMSNKDLEIPSSTN